MKKKPTKELISCVNAYLMARCHAEAQRGTVDKIEREILAEMQCCPDPKWEKYGDKSGKCDSVITDPKNAYLLSDSDHADYLSAVRQELVKAGYDISDIPGEPYHSFSCPALCAESLQHDAETLLIEAGAKMLGVDNPEEFNTKLLCFCSNGKTGLEHRQEFIDLLVKLVVNYPGYRNPLTKK